MQDTKKERGSVPHCQLLLPEYSHSVQKHRSLSRCSFVSCTAQLGLAVLVLLLAETVQTKIQLVLTVQKIAPHGKTGLNQGLVFSRFQLYNFQDFCLHIAGEQ